MLNKIKKLTSKKDIISYYESSNTKTVGIKLTQYIRASICVTEEGIFVCSKFLFSSDTEIYFIKGFEKDNFIFVLELITEEKISEEILESLLNRLNIEWEE